MKKTLYQILGVDPKASKQEIEAAYIARIDELQYATLQDPNKLRVLQQSRDVLSDASRRATYDASLAHADAPLKVSPIAQPEPTFMEQWGKFIAPAVVVLVAIIWWSSRSSTPPPQPVQQPKPVAKAAPAAAAPVVSIVAPVTAVSAVITEPARAEAPASPLTGDWSCTDAINGHSSKYSFKDGGVLTIVTNEGQSSDYKYELAGKSLTLTDPKQVSTIAIEEMLARKMILHSGGAGQRVVCMR